MKMLLLLLAAASAIAQTPEELEHRVVARVQSALELRPGSAAADLGSGDSPDLAMHILQAVGDSGKAIYVDIDPAVVEKLARKLKESGVGNARAQLGKPDDPLLAPASLDAALIVFAYHEMSEHASMLSRLFQALRPGGRLAVIEASTDKFRGSPRAVQVQEHELSSDILERELKSAGFDTRTETLVQGDGIVRYLTVARRP